MKRLVDMRLLILFIVLRGFSQDHDHACRRKDDAAMRGKARQEVQLLQAAKRD